VQKGEGDPAAKGPKPEFGKPLKTRQHQGELFPEGDDLPLFSGTPQPVVDRPFVPEAHAWKQTMIPGMPDRDLDVVRAKDRALRRRRKGSLPVTLESAAIFVDTPAPPSDQSDASK
jgi:hypothetical protein